MAKPLNLLHHAQHFGNVFHSCRTHGDEEHSFVLTNHKPGTTGTSADAPHLEKIPTVPTIIFNLPFVLHDHFVDLTLVCLHLRNPFNPHTWFRSRGHRGSSRG